MTAQYPERLVLDGVMHDMCATPLSSCALKGQFPSFVSPSTACWRGYVGTWEIVDGRLYLIEFIGFLNYDGDEADLQTLFPDATDRVFADWYSGVIRIPQGKLLHYEHMGYESTYERDLIIEIDAGTVTKSEVRGNGVTDTDDGPEGYQVAACTVFRGGQ